MKKLGLIFSHKLTEDQISDAKNKLKCNKIIELPDNLQKIWSEVNPERFEEEKLKKIKKFILDNFDKGDYILIQGEWGFTYKLIRFAKKNHLIAIYASTKRVSRDISRKDGSVNKISCFKHVKYKRYY